jgi:subtilisin family serine protease
MKKRRITELEQGPPSAPPPVFGEGDDNVVPGEVVFALEADAATAIETSIASVPAPDLGEGETTALGSAGVDKALKRLGVRSVRRVHGPGPTKVTAGIAMASDLGLDTTIRVRYDGDESPDAVAKKLDKLDEVAWAEPARWREASVVPNDPRFGAQWGLTRIGCPDAWDHTVGDPSVVVAVVDTGIDLNHPELAPLLVGGQDMVDFPATATPKPGWVFEGDFTGVDSTPQDEVGHGTHVAGTIACSTNDGVGVAGVTWNARLMPVKVLARIRETATGRVSGSGSSVHIAAGIRWAADHGARVINMSLGGPATTMVEREAVAYAISRGVVVVAAMGNDNSNAEHFPAAHPGVIAVGATTSADQRASFSNKGAWIDIAAPGVGIESTFWDDTYATLNGTSMASPHVAGVAALVLSRNSSLTADQVGNILRSTAKPLRDEPADPVPNDRYGHGLVQAGAAVAAAAPAIVKSRPVVTCLDEPVLPLSKVIICRTHTPICKSRMFITCQKTLDLVTCHKTLDFRTCRSVTLPCPSEPPVTCLKSIGPGCIPVSLADCPSFPCRPGGGERINPGPLAADWEEYDPHGYDPYGPGYE